MKKVLSIFLCVVILALIAAPAFVSAQAPCECDETPIIYVRGRTSIYIEKNIRDNSNNIKLPYLPEGYLEPAIKELVPIYYKGYKTDNFEEFRVALLGHIEKVFEGYTLDKNGEVTNNSGIGYDDNYLNDTVYPDHRATFDITTPKGCSDELYKFDFHYDCRVSPLVSADQLHEYVEIVKQQTGHSKIKFLARCMGSVILSAYFAKYGWKDVEDVVIYNATVFGTEINNSVFTGQLYFDADGVDFIATQELGEEFLFRFIKNIISQANKTYALDLTMAYFNMTAQKVGKYVMPSCLLACFGSTPGYWSMISPEVYLEARDFIFKGVEEEYAGLIEKTDNYYYNVGVKLKWMYRKMQSEGVNVNFISKYGLQVYPVMKECHATSDQIISCVQQAPGTICAPIGETLSKKYIKSVKEAGSEKYLSPDGCIDASNALARDNTWYIKNLIHNSFPYVVDELIYTLFRSNGEMNVHTNERFPQFLVYTGDDENLNDRIYPQTQEDYGYTLKHKDFFQLIWEMIKMIFEHIKEMLFTKNEDIEPIEQP